MMPQIAEIIKYDGDGSVFNETLNRWESFPEQDGKRPNTVFVWKHPLEDFNSLTQLIVHESQEAVFFANGQALDLFAPGRYTLETQNLPQITRFFGRTANDPTPFHCEVYFVNKVEQMAIKWGTDDQVEYIEPTYHFPLKIGASGEMSLRVEDSRKLLLKLVGTEKELSQQRLVSFFRAILMTKVKTYIAQFMSSNAVSIFEIDAHLSTFSDALKNLLLADFSNYGVSLELFLVTSVVKDSEQYQRLKTLHFRQFADVADAKIKQQVKIIEQQTEAQKLIIESQAIATKRAQEGYTYQQERGFDVAAHVAQNDAVAQFTNVGMGLGTIAGVGGTLGGMVGRMLNDAMNGLGGNKSSGIVIPKGSTCPKCGNFFPEGAKFCLECGTKLEHIILDEIVCPSCGKQTPKGKFCVECGAPLIRKCSNCGAEPPIGAKFCLECGQKL